MDSIDLFFGYINGMICGKNDEQSLQSEIEVKKNNPENYQTSVPVKTENQYSTPKMNIYYSYQNFSGTL